MKKIFFQNLEKFLEFKQWWIVFPQKKIILIFTWRKYVADFKVLLIIISWANNVGARFN